MVLLSVRISISEETHSEGRTYGKKNEKIAELIDGLSSKSLWLATLKDFATILWYEKIKKNDMTSYNEVLKGFATVYKRNKQLCLYDL